MEYVSTADIEGNYRYRLERRWGDGPAFVVIGVNPSTADATHDDATIRRCLGFARAHGCGALVMVNLFAFRSTDVRALPANHREANGPRNDDAVLSACRLPGAVVVCAWGSRTKLRPPLRSRAFMLTGWLRAQGVQLHVLRLTKAGDPEHPLYLPGELRAEVWNG